MAQIERGEARIQRRISIKKALDTKVSLLCFSLPLFPRAKAASCCAVYLPSLCYQYVKKTSLGTISLSSVCSVTTFSFSVEALFLCRFYF